MKPDLEESIVRCLQENVNAFAWSVADMPGIYSDIICHKLSIDNKVKPIMQQRKKLEGEKKEAVMQEVEKLRKVGHVR